MEVPAPDLPYRPRMPGRRFGIGLVGAGAIAAHHLGAYRDWGLDVAAILDLDPARAAARRDAFAPGADVMKDLPALLARGDIDVVDVAAHPEQRPPLVEAALRAGKHVLSQKPFVTDLDEGLRLCDLADQQGVRLAVNQNGRWAPHMAWMREAVRAGLVGEVLSVHVSIAWDHRWIAGTPFDGVRDVLLYDFAIHWFDFLQTLLGRPARAALAQVVATPSSGVAPPLLAGALVDWGGAQASLALSAAAPAGEDATFVAGTLGSLAARGPDIFTQSVELRTAAGVARPRLEGSWYDDGFAGAMGEMLCAVEEGRPPAHAARENLDGLALCFAAVASAREGRPVAPGEVRRLPDQRMAA